LVRANSKADRPNDGFDAALRRGIGAASARHRRGSVPASESLQAGSASVRRRPTFTRVDLPRRPAEFDLDW